MLDFITWTADPAIFSIGSREIRWYGLAFAIGFLIGYKIVEKMWKREKLNPAWRGGCRARFRKIIPGDQSSIR